MNSPNTHKSKGSRRPRNRTSHARATRGFALIAALILLVVLSGIGSVMLRLSGLEQAGSSIAILGARANWAAQSGIEWAIHQAVSTGSCSSATLALNEGVLSGFQVVVTCTSSAHQEGGEEYTSLSIRSEASFGPIGSRDHVFREVQATLVL